MKTLITIILLAILGVVSFGVYESHKERSDRVADEAAEGRAYLARGAEKYNLTQCFKHLGLSEDTADKSSKWRAFKKAHHIDYSPSAMSDEDLKACEAL
jgi:hypothetical protein